MCVCVCVLYVNLRIQIYVINLVKWMKIVVSCSVHTVNQTPLPGRVHYRKPQETEGESGLTPLHLKVIRMQNGLGEEAGQRLILYDRPGSVPCWTGHLCKLATFHHKETSLRGWDLPLLGHQSPRAHGWAMPTAGSPVSPLEPADQGASRCSQLASLSDPLHKPTLPEPIIVLNRTP